MDSPRLKNKDHLLEEFVLAANELSVMYTAEDAAQQSELYAKGLMSGIRAQNGLYITPHDMSEDAREEFMVMSADVQLKKQQSFQISAVAQEQIALQEANLHKSFKGTKITFSAIDKSYQPFESMWFDPRTGKWDNVLLKTSSITGIIEDISLSRNVVVLKPIYWQRKLNPNRKFLLAYIINPSTLALAVSVS